MGSVKDFGVLLVLISLFVCPLAAPNRNTNTKLNGLRNIFDVTALVATYGYAGETHQVVTEDGYILTMHRMPYGINQQYSSDRPAVFLMHGLFSASFAYTFREPEYGFAYHLADAGFDVWLGNARGNRLSRAHLTLDPDDDVQKFTFFDFSWEEIGRYDVAAMIDYILDLTGHRQLHYIGHSQGGTTFLVLNSLRPEYNDKIASAHLLAGVGHMAFFPDQELREYAAMTTIIYNYALAIGIVELFPPNTTVLVSDAETNGNYSRADYCAGDISYSDLCHQMGINLILKNNKLYEIDDDVEEDVGDVTEEAGDESDDLLSILEGMDSEYTAGGSLKQIAHYGQNIRDGRFARWNYGTIQNLFTYGSLNSPLYDLSLITINTTMHYSLNDDLLDERDVLSMVELMPNTVARKVARDNFTHEEYVYADDAKDLVTDFIIASMWDIENNRVEEVTEETDAPTQEPTVATEVPTVVTQATEADAEVVVVVEAESTETENETESPVIVDNNNSATTLSHLSVMLQCYLIMTGLFVMLK